MNKFREMYPDLSYFFYKVFGTQPDNWTAVFKSFGLMLGFAFLACGMLLRSELMRLEKLGYIKATTKEEKPESMYNADFYWNLVLSIFLGAKLPLIFGDFSAFKADPASVIFSLEGNFLVGLLIGAAVFYYYYKNQPKEQNTKPILVTVHPHQRTTDIIFIAAISGVIGARLFSILENFSDFLRDPAGQLFAGSGLTVYGGIILAFIAVYYYVNKHGIKPVYMMDIAGMGILLGYAIGRIGCQLSGDGDWGIVAANMPDWWFLPDWLWAYDYPNNVLNEGKLLAGCNEAIYLATPGSAETRCAAACGLRYCHALEAPVYPTPVYETTISLLGFGLLFFLRNKIKTAGLLFFLYMIYNGVERFFIEGIRVNERYDLLGMHYSQAQYISIAFVLIGFAGAVYLSIKKSPNGSQIES